MLGPPADAAGAWLQEEVNRYRTRRAVEALNRFAQIVQDMGEPIREPDAGVFTHMIAGAASATEPELTEMWAGLLAGTLYDEDGEHPAFRLFLAQLGSDEVRVLRDLHAAPRWIERTISEDRTSFGGRIVAHAFPAASLRGPHLLYAEPSFVRLLEQPGARGLLAHMRGMPASTFPDGHVGSRPGARKAPPPACMQGVLVAAGDPE